MVVSQVVLWVVNWLRQEREEIVGSSLATEKTSVLARSVLKSRTMLAVATLFLPCADTQAADPR